MNNLSDDFSFDYGEIYNACILGGRSESIQQWIRISHILKTIIKTIKNPVISCSIKSNIGVETLSVLKTNTDLIFRPRLYLDDELRDLYYREIEEFNIEKNQYFFIRNSESIHQLLSTSYYLICPWPNITSYDMDIINSACIESDKIGHRFIFVSFDKALLFRSDEFALKTGHAVNPDELMAYISAIFEHSKNRNVL